MLWRQEVTAAQWESLRQECWELWLKAEQDSPPHAARHDGIVGAAARLQFAPPEQYIDGWDATPKIRELAARGLSKVAAFKRANPEAANTITKPLREYERRLREVRDHPEQRLLGADFSRPVACLAAAGPSSQADPQNLPRKPPYGPLGRPVGLALSRLACLLRCMEGSVPSRSSWACYQGARAATRIPPHPGLQGRRGGQRRSRPPTFPSRGQAPASARP
jgi:hypothetical protein